MFVVCDGHMHSSSNISQKSVFLANSRYLMNISFLIFLEEKDTSIWKGCGKLEWLENSTVKMGSLFLSD